MMEQKRIAIINSVMIDSTGKIGNNFLLFLLKNKYQAFFCYGRGKKNKDKSYYKIDTKLEFYFHAFLSRIFGNQGSYSFFATKRLVRFLKKNKINIIYGIGLHGYYLNEKLFFNFMAKEKIKFIYIMTEEYAYLGKCGNSNDCTHYLNECRFCPHIHEYPKSLFFDRAHSMFIMKKRLYSLLTDPIFVGPEFTINAFKKSPLSAGISSKIIDESIDTSFFHPCNFSNLKKQLEIDSSKIVILCVAPSKYERKGTRFFMEAANRMIDDKRFVFVHVGYTGDLSICPSNFIPISYIYDQKILRDYYSMGDLFVFPSLIDTMPNACLEALSCGTPLLMFNISGMPYVGDSSVATLVEPENVDCLCSEIRKCQAKGPKIIKRCRDYALKRYNNQNYYEKLLKL